MLRTPRSPAFFHFSRSNSRHRSLVRLAPGHRLDLEPVTTITGSISEVRRLLTTPSSLCVSAASRSARSSIRCAPTVTSSSRAPCSRSTAARCQTSWHRRSAVSLDRVGARRHASAKRDPEQGWAGVLGLPLTMSIAAATDGGLDASKSASGPPSSRPLCVPHSPLARKEKTLTHSNADGRGMRGDRLGRG